MDSLTAGNGTSCALFNKLTRCKLLTLKYLIIMAHYVKILKLVLFGMRSRNRSKDKSKSRKLF